MEPKPLLELCFNFPFSISPNLFSKLYSIKIYLASSSRRCSKRRVCQILIKIRSIKSLVQWTVLTWKKPVFPTYLWNMRHCIFSQNTENTSARNTNPEASVAWFGSRYACVKVLQYPQKKKRKPRNVCFSWEGWESAKIFNAGASKWRWAKLSTLLVIQVTSIWRTKNCVLYDVFFEGSGWHHSIRAYAIE